MHNSYGEAPFPHFEGSGCTTPFSFPFYFLGIFRDLCDPILPDDHVRFASCPLAHFYMLLFTDTLVLFYSIL